MMLTVSANSDPHKYQRDRAYKMLERKFNKGSSSYSRKHRKAAVEEVVTHHYIHHVHPVVLREVRNRRVRHIIQPIIHDAEEDELVVDSYTRPAVYREMHEEPESSVADKLRINREILTEVGNRQVEAEIHSEIQQEAIVQEVVHDEYVEEIQPVIQRTVKKPLIVHETAPVYESVTRTVGVEDIQTMKPMTANEWDERKTSGEPHVTSTQQDETIPEQT